MKRHAPDVRQYMTRLPVEAERCETVTQAIALMRANKIHHLPVMSGSHLKGIVSLRDLSANPGLADVLLEEVCQSDAVKVSPVTPIDEVVRELLRKETDNAVVMDGGFVVGIFTTTDALRFISDNYGQSSQ